MFNPVLLGITYFVFLCYLFLGISIIADIFMEAIEVITSKTTPVTTTDGEGKTFIVDVAVWNPTIANLTLMALGSSAPEILLSVIGVVTTLGKPADELGPASIVGSAAFNLLVISAVSILAIGDEIKKIYDLGVFLTTSIFSVFAYIWMYLCLSVMSEGIVTLLEAWLTLIFFFILVIMAFGMDKYNESKMKKIEDAHQHKMDEEERNMKVKK